MQPPEKPLEGPVEPLVPEAPPAFAEARVPAAATAAPELKPEDFALLNRLPARKPETFDRDAIKRAGLMVGGLALGLWIVTTIARPPASETPVAEPPEESYVQEAPPITSTGNGLAPAPQDLAPTPEIISLTPAPAWTPAAPAPAAPGAMQAGQAPARRGQADPAQGGLGTESGWDAPPAVADTPDPSNLFTAP